MANWEIRSTDELEFTMSFKDNGKTPNSITIACHYSDKVDRRTMNGVIAIHRDLLEKIAKSRGWDKWLQIEERLALVKF